MFGPQDAHWALDILRSLLSSLDKLIYQGIELVLQGIFDLASLKTSSGLLNDINVKIYVLVGIIMAFKLSFSFFQYIVSPDQMTDKGEKGVSNLFIRLAVMLLLLVTLPSILFGGQNSKGLLTEAQEIILPMIPNLLMNDGERVAPIRETTKDAAREMTLAALGAFYFQPDELKDKCPADPIMSLEDFTKTINARCNFLGKQYQFTYAFGAITVIGIFILLMFVNISIEVAKRVFKLLILEILAPIPIISYIDPKSSKDGTFSKWVQSLTSTFLSLFLRIGIVYLMLFFISKMGQNGLFSNFPEEGFVRRAYLTIFLILGLIYFAKEAPKFIQDSFGLKDAGGGNFGLGTVAALGGMVGAGAASYKASKLGDEARGQEPNKGKALAAGLLGGAGGLATGMYAAGDKNKAGDVNKALRERNAKVLAQGASGSTVWGRLGAQTSQMFGGESSAAQLERKIAGEEATKANLTGLVDYAKKKAETNKNTVGSFSDDQWKHLKFNYSDVKARYNNSNPSDTNFTAYDTDGNAYQIDKTFFSKEENALLTSNADSYIAYSGYGIHHEAGKSVEKKDIDDELVRMLQKTEEGNIKFTNKKGENVSLNKATMSDSSANPIKSIKEYSDQMGTNISKEKDKLEKLKANDRHAKK